MLFLAFKVNLCTGLTVCKRSYSQVFQDRPFFTSIIRSLLFTSVCAFSSIYLVWLIVWSRRRISGSGCLMVHRIDLPVALRLKELLGLISLNMVLSSRWSMETNILYSDFLPLYIYCNTDTDCLFAKVYIEVGRGIISCASISKKLLLFSVFFWHNFPLEKKTRSSYLCKTHIFTPENVHS